MTLRMRKNSFKLIVESFIYSRDFHKHTTLAITLILASEALLRKNKKSSDKMIPPVRIEPNPLTNF